MTALSGMSARWIGHDSGVAMTSTDFLDTLATDVPETGSVVAEHVADNDGLSCTCSPQT
jgi:hypothetical protein